VDLGDWPAFGALMDNAARLSLQEVHDEMPLWVSDRTVALLCICKSPMWTYSAITVIADKMCRVISDFACRRMGCGEPQKSLTIGSWMERWPGKGTQRLPAGGVGGDRDCLVRWEVEYIIVPPRRGPAIRINLSVLNPKDRIAPSTGLLSSCPSPPTSVIE